MRVSVRLSGFCGVRVRPGDLEALIRRALPALEWSSLVEVAVTDRGRVLTTVCRLLGVRVRRTGVSACYVPS